jgi:hypothetical protein
MIMYKGASRLELPLLVISPAASDVFVYITQEVLLREIKMCLVYRTQHSRPQSTKSEKKLRPLLSSALSPLSWDRLVLKFSRTPYDSVSVVSSDD